MKSLSIPFFIAVFLLIQGCASTTGKSPEDQRQAVLSMRNDVLTDLYKIKPDVKAQIASAPGYAVFSNANINIVFASFGGGYGVVSNNATGKNTYMKMGEVGVGLGLGIKDFRVVFVFNDTDSMTHFIDEGWSAGIQADAAAKAGDQGAAVGGEMSIDNVTVYQLTESGLALQATIKGTKYWQDAELN